MGAAPFLAPAFPNNPVWSFCFSFNDQKYTYLHLDKVTDDCSYPIQKHFKEAIEFIDASLAEGSKVLVHWFVPFSALHSQPFQQCRKVQISDNSAGIFDVETKDNLRGSIHVGEQDTQFAVEYGLHYHSASI